MTNVITEPASIDETALLDGLRRGDERASEALVRAHAGAMLAVARRFVGNDDDAADVVQDAFLSAFRSLNSFQGQSRLGTWLHRIVVNHSLMRLRSRKRRGEVAIDGLLPKFDETGHHARRIVPWSRPEDALSRAEVRDHVRECIDRLPDSYRTVVVLRDIEQYDTQQTAEQLGISFEAVKVRLHRARQALRTLLEPVFGLANKD
jgi:RNA polymerase sigma-70 factor, ECF subfamily